MRLPDARILIFAKAPRPGRVKTRLIPALGEAGACALHTRLLRHTLHKLCGAALAPVELWCAPDCDHPVFAELARTYPVALFSQQGADLGQRMAHAASQALERTPRVLLVGIDAPALAPGHLQRALFALEEAEVVMIPAEDGGYVLLGLRDRVPGLFDRMPWGTDRVAELTRSRCSDLGLTTRELETLWDVDRPEDLARLTRDSALAEGDAGAAG